jgi:hypothetical protein
MSTGFARAYSPEFRKIRKSYRSHQDVARTVCGLYQFIQRESSIIAPGPAGRCLPLHLARVAYYHFMGTDGQDPEITLAALIHDLGKLSWPIRFHDFGYVFTEEDFATMRNHVAESDDIIATIKLPKRVRNVARHHHEKWDGSGYPNRLAGEEISEEGLKVAVGDCVDAISDPARRYRGVAPLSLGDAVVKLEKNADKDYGPVGSPARLFLQSLSRKTQHEGLVVPDPEQVSYFLASFFVSTGVPDSMIEACVPLYKPQAFAVTDARR